MVPKLNSRTLKLVGSFLLLGICQLEANGQSVATADTRRLVENAKSPTAKIADVAWIAGSWIGQAMGGQFEETWNPPTGDSMLGMFKLVVDGKTEFSEHMAIVQTGDSLVLKVKHFDADFVGWEEKDKSVEFPLVEFSDHAVYFEGFTFRKTGDSSMSIFVVIGQEEGGQSTEVEFAAKRAKAPVTGTLESQDQQQAWIEEIDAYARKVARDWDVPGLAIAVVKDDQVVFAKGYGVRELGKTDVVDADTLFAIASNSKAFTAAALGILIDDGKLSWNDPVIKYLPQFQMPDPWITREMTVVDLLCHRSGMDTFSGDLLWYDTNYTADEIIRRIRFLSPVSSFRSRFGYQNLMYITAGKVIEQVSGMNWGEFVKSRILEPSGMDRTTTSITDMTNNFALPHNRSGQNDELRPLPLGNVDNCWGACGLNASVKDLARWMRLQLAGGKIDGNQIISNNRLFEMWQPGTPVPLSPAAVESEPTRNFQSYGLGYFLNDLHGRKVVSHSGGLDGMISQLALVPSENLGVTVLTNSESGASKFIRDRVLECFLGVQNRIDQSAKAVSRLAETDQSDAKKRDEKDAARVKNAPTTIGLADFAGRFRSKLYGDVTIQLEGDHLVLRMQPAANFVADLEHWHYNTFQIHWRDTVKYDFPRGFVNFTLDAAGKPRQLVFDQPNNDFWFYELELFRVDE